jgi:uncharacterized delta-60 repeat protein
MSQQQTVLRVQTNIPHATISGTTEFTTLDLYSDSPIKINQSFAELQDIGSKNSDYSIGLSLPGSKKNNVFFESFFNVDTQSLYFNATQNIACSVLISEQSYFTGYMKLNKVSVMNSKVEYDVTLFSSIGNLFGDIGNNLLKDLNFDDPEYTFNHTFDFYDSIADPYENQSSNFGRKNEKPFMYYYPIVHNGYEYTGSTVNVSGGTAELQTRLYTSTIPVGSFPSLTGLTGYKPYRINSQGPDDGLIDNQLKPALSMWGLMKLIFKTYNYTITSDFMNTPWMKTLYMYGYYGSDKTKFSYKIQTIQSLPLEGVELIYSGSTATGSTLNIIVCKRGTGIPCFSTQDVSYGFANMFPYSEFGTIPRGTSGLTITAVEGFDFGFEVGGVPVADISTLKYSPKNVGDSVSFVDGDFVNFNLVIDENIKQIDLLSSIAKKFNLVFIPDPDNSRNIIIESYPFYVGTGNVYDWTPKLSYDKGFTVEPALNYIESNIIWTDQEDGDYGNKQFKDKNKQIYGQKNFYGPTNFKSQEKKIDTIFSAEVLRQWDTADQLGADVSQGIKLPLGINYVGSSSTQEVGNTTETYYAYKGLKSKPKLFWFLGSANLFLDTLGEVYATSGFTTYDVKILSSDKVNTRSVRTAPIISHTMPMGMSDTQKINNDNACILFNSEQPVDVGVSTYNTYTENDVYALFYSNRIDNLYDVNTRFIKGYFDLKLSDISNLKNNDIIKIQEQFFIVNKINGFNLTNRELTEVELLQYNLNPQEYPTRYFKYQYCDQLGYCFKIKTDFTNPSLIDTQFGWSVWYDQSVGTFTGTTVTGFTSTIRDVGGLTYVPFTISEITKDEYDNGGCYDISCDTLIDYVWNFVNPSFPNIEYAFGFGLPSFWISGDGEYEGLNLWRNCSDFNTTSTTYGILTGSSINHGEPTCDNDCFNEHIHFQTSGNTAGTIREVLINEDLTTYVGGTFRKYNGVTTGGITGNTGPNMIKLNSNGSVDTSFTNYGFGQTGIMFVFKKQSTGKLIVGGNFSSYSGNTRNGILRLNTNGTLDTTFNANTVITGTTFSVNDIQILSDDSIICVGSFTLSGSTTATSIVKLNSNGALETGFTTNLVTTGSSIYDVEVYNGQASGLYDGKIMVCGNFTTWSGVSRNFIARLNSNGTLDTSFVIGTGFTTGSTVSNVEIQSDGKIIVGGSFTSYSGTTGLQGLCRLNIDGTLDTTFQTNFTGGTSYSSFRPLYLQTGQILLPIEIISGVTTNRYFYKLNNDGSIDTTFNRGDWSSGVYNFSTEGATAVQTDGTIYFGANFEYYNNKKLWSIVKLKSNGDFVDCTI